MTARATAEVRLRDGSKATIRPITPQDRSQLVAAFEALGPESRYRRFLTPMSRLSNHALSYLVEVDHRDHEALLAKSEPTGQPLGVARYVRSDEDPAAAEIGVAVVDHAQGNGVGSALLHRLADRAREEGITRFTGLVLLENRAMLDLLGELGTAKRRPGGAGTVEVTVELPAKAGIGTRLRKWLQAAASQEVSFKSPTHPADR